MQNKMMYIVSFILFGIHLSWAQVSIKPNFLNIDNHDLSNTPGLSIKGANYQNSIGLSNGSQEWRLVNWDNEFRLIQYTAPVISPFRVIKNAFSNAIVLTPTGVGFGTATPDYKFDFEGSVGINTAVGNLYLGYQSAVKNEGHLFGTMNGGQFLKLISYGMSDWQYIMFDGINRRMSVGHGEGDDLAPVTTLQVYDETNDAVNIGPRSGTAWGYVNVERPLGNTSVIGKWRDGTNTVMDIDGTAAAYQLTVFGDALASGGNWVSSDKRLKANIKGVNKALDMVMKLEAKSYRYEAAKYAFLNLPQGQQFGFLAQDVAKVIPEIVRESTFKNADAPKEETYELQSINYTAVIPILTAAMQEQQRLIERQGDELEQLRLENQEIRRLLEEVLEKTGVNADRAFIGPNPSARLDQNVPNPFTRTTSIRFYIPENSSTSTLVIFNEVGQQVRSIPVEQTGEGQVQISLNELTTGTYSYSLWVDGRIVGSKMMIANR
jgi:hypothetical protein